MPNTNNRNLLYFEADSMRSLYDSMDEWQATEVKRLLSVSIHRDGDRYCCIALTNPSEVIIVSDPNSRGSGAKVEGGYLHVYAAMRR